MRRQNSSSDRYMFRFEFRNDCVTQPWSLLQKHAHSSKMCKKSQAPKRIQRFGQNFCDAMIGRDEVAEAIRENEQQHAHQQYLRTEVDLARSLVDTVDRFVDAVNVNSDNGTVIGHDVPRKSTWSSSLGSEDEEKEPLQSDEEDDDFSASEPSDSESDDNDEH